MLPICVVNNYGQFNHLIHRALRDLDIDVMLIPNTTPKEEVAAAYRGIILGGGPAIERAGVCAEYLDSGSRFLGSASGFISSRVSLAAVFIRENPGDTDRLRSLYVIMTISWQGILRRFRSGRHMRMRSAGCQMDLPS